MSIKKFIYWVIFFAVTIGGIIYGWPGQTPTYRVPIWLPKGNPDSSLGLEWLQSRKVSNQSLTLEEFKGKNFPSTWYFVTYRTAVDDLPEDGPWYLVYLGRDGLGNIYQARSYVGGVPGLVSWTDTWLRPVLLDTAVIDPDGFLVVQTRPDWFYWIKSGLAAVFIAIIVILILAARFGTDSQLIVRWPVSRLPKPILNLPTEAIETAPLPEEKKKGRGNKKRKARPTG